MTRLNPIPVVFGQAGHTYTNTETGEQYKGITSTLLRRLFPDKYGSVPPDILRQAAERGSTVHADIELAESLGTEPSTQEGANYLRLKERHGLRCLATEHTVSDLKRYATNIDAVYEAEDNVVDLADFKTTAKFDRESVSWQLSVCARMLLLNNPHLTVRRLFGIWLRGGTAQLVEVPRRTDGEVDALMEADQADRPYAFAPMFPSYIADNEARLYALGKQIKELEEEYEALKGEVLAQMAEHGDKSFDTGSVLLTVVAPAERTTFDGKAFQQDNPELYGQYLKKTMTKESLKITLR